MPIRPENLKRYPPSWREISRRIRFDRAKGRCECAGQCGRDHRADNRPQFDDEDRCDAVHGEPHPVTRSLVVLTVAHLDHTPENCDDANLVAMCQKCHNAYDAPERRRGMAERARKAAAVADLFDKP